MAGINMESILAKAKACTNTSQFQQKVQQKADVLIREGGVAQTSSGRMVTISGMQMAAAKFIEVLQNEIESSGIAIADAISLTRSDPYKVGTNKYQIQVSFTGDLHRDSLVAGKYDGADDGVDNIIALFNNGYSAGNTVYGIWHGEQIASLPTRPGIHFIASAVRNYMANYASEYGVIDIEVNPIYK